MRRLLNLQLAFLFMLLAACAQLGVQAPKTFNEKALAAAMAVETVQKQAAALLRAGKISAADAENVLKATDLATEGIKIARAYSAASPDAASSRLDAAVAALAVWTTYLATKEK